MKLDQIIAVISSHYYEIIVTANKGFDNVNQYVFLCAGYITDGDGIIFDYHAYNGDPTTYSKNPHCTFGQTKKKQVLPDRNQDA